MITFIIQALFIKIQLNMSEHEKKISVLSESIVRVCLQV